jgi:hypothetical protein
MKKIFSFALMLLGGFAMLTSCSDDRDSNPTLIQPDVLVLNETNWRGSTVELENTADSVLLSWSAPKYTTDNAAILVNYEIDFSPKGTFNQIYDATAEDNSNADYVTMGKPQSQCSVKYSAKDLNAAYLQIYGWTTAEEVPGALPGAFRVRAYVKKATQEVIDGSQITSNEVTIKVLPYFILLKPADPEIWWLIGSDIADGTWGSDIGKCVIPMQTIEDESYDMTTGKGKIQWTGYLAGKGFKLRGALDDGWAAQWGQGDSFGEFKKNDGGSANISVPSAGIYTVTLHTGEDKLTVEAVADAPKVFTGMCISGSFNGWGDTDMIPCSTGWENHDWYLEYTFSTGDEVKIKEAGSWDFNCGGSLNEREDGFYIYGQQNGDNLWIPEDGTYIILFNDITRYIRLIKK